MKKTLSVWLRAAVLVLCLMLACTAYASGYDGHVLVLSKNEGACGALLGEVELDVLSINTSAEQWDSKELATLRQEVDKAIDSLEQQAKAYGASVNITPVYFELTTPMPVEPNNTWVKKILRDVDGLRLGTADWTDKALMICFPSSGRAFAQTAYDSKLEFVITYGNDDAAVFQHELLHLFGAEDMYIHNDIEAAAMQYFPDSIMLRTAQENSIDSLTAYLIGWLDRPDAQGQQFLQLTRHLTEADLRAALGDELFTGEGIVQRHDGVYEGQLQDGLFHGYGTMKWNDGSSYTGDWVWGELHGWGTFTWAGGTTYTGPYVDGIREGTGTMVWADGNRYEGAFKNGEMDGYGVMYWANGSVYQGEYVNGVRHGHGVFTWANGTVYEGVFDNNSRTGYGTLTFTDGMRYEGEFLNDQYHGQGTMTFSNGKVQKGTWVNGEFSK